MTSLEHSLGHEFSDPGLLARALTHSSRSRQNNERLEFLGDRVLALVIAEWLSELHPQAKEGALAKALAALVARDSLASVAGAIDLGAQLRLHSADHNNPSILADACEAVIAALYIDGGLEAARRFIRAQWQGLVASPPRSGDAKTKLQEWSQSQGLGLPAYHEKTRAGPDHAPSFVIEVQIAGLEPLAATGSSKRLAERAAAEAMLQKVYGT